jgi:hypothetical protein
MGHHLAHVGHAGIGVAGLESKHGRGHAPARFGEFAQGIAGGANDQRNNQGRLPGALSGGEGGGSSAENRRKRKLFQYVLVELRGFEPMCIAAQIPLKPASVVFSCSLKKEGFQGIPKGCLKISFERNAKRRRL